MFADTEAIVAIQPLCPLKHDKKSIKRRKK